MTKKDAIRQYGSWANYCEAEGSRWLAGGNEAEERGDTDKAEKCFAKSQAWLDRANVSRGWN